MKWIIAIALAATAVVGMAAKSNAVTKVQSAQAHRASQIEKALGEN